MARIAIHTLGTCGDVQPYVALGQGLHEAGHQVCLATSPQFESFVTGYGLEFAPLPGDLVDLLGTPLGQQAVSGRHRLRALFTLMRQIRPMYRRLLDAQWDACNEIDAIVYHPKAIGGVHIAEKLGIPAFLALPLPGLTPTRAFPNPLLAFSNLGPFNRFSYWPIIRFGDLGFRRIVASWRGEVLGLPAKHQWLSLKGEPVTRLYACSPAIVPIPGDWDDTSSMTGTWFLKEDRPWRPPALLEAFLEQGHAPVYVGFGSLPSEDAEGLADLAVSALQQAGQRGILASGWGGLKPRNLPPDMFSIEQAPHDWLFARMAAIVHHGGAGTTAAGLKAGRPAIICPFFGDQPFWANRVFQLGAGPKPIPLRKLTAERLASAIRQAVGSAEMNARAGKIGAALIAEDGVKTAVKLIEARLAGCGSASTGRAMPALLSILP